MKRSSGIESDPLERHSLSPRELKSLLEARRAGRPVLAFRDPENALTILPLVGDRRVTVGRHVEADLSLSWDQEVSGLHAELEYLAAEWTIADDGLSRNGTYVNGTRLVRRHRLRDGDRIRVGRTIIVYVGLAQRAATAAAVDSPEVKLTDTQRRVLIALCRPCIDGGNFANPASNRAIGEEVYLGIDAVKLHLRTLFGKFGLSDLAQNQKRAKLAEYALVSGAISRRDLVRPE